MLRYGTAPWILHMELKHGRERESIHEPHLSDYAVTLARDVIRAHQPELTAIHLVDVDETRHHTGVNSPETAAAKARMGRRVAALWQTIRETPGMADALMVLVSDHGQADVSRTVCLADYLAAHGLPDAARVQSNGMSAYLFPGASGDEGAARAEALLRGAGAEAGVQHVYSREELNALGCVAGGRLCRGGGPGGGVFRRAAAGEAGEGDPRLRAGSSGGELPVRRARTRRPRGRLAARNGDAGRRADRRRVDGRSAPRGDRRRSTYTVGVKVGNICRIGQ